jgi:hypothetical protein
VPHVFYVSAVLGVGGVLGLVLTERTFRPSQSAFLPGSL